MTNPLQLFVSLCIGAIGGVLAYKAGIPAGGMVGSMLAVALVNIVVYPMPLLPSEIRLGAQIVIGTALGLQVTKEAVLSLKDLVIPAAFMIVTLIGAGLLIGFALHKLTGWDIVTSMTAASPGGMTEMSLVCEALGGDTPRTALLQLVRMICVVSVVPGVLKLILSYTSQTP